MSSISLGNINNVGEVETINYIDSTGEVVVVYTNGSEFTLQTEQNASAPEIISHVIDNNNLFAIFSNGEEAFVASMDSLGVKAVTNIEYSATLNGVIVNYADGTSDIFTDIENIPKTTVSSTYIDENTLTLYAIYSDGETKAVADLKFLAEKSLYGDITDVKTNDDNELIVETTTGVYNLGPAQPPKVIQGEDAVASPRITDLSINNDTGLLEATFSDGTITEVGKAQNVTLEGSEIALLSTEINEDGHLLITTDSETQGINTVDVGRVRGKDGKDGTIFEEVKVSHDGEIRFISEKGTTYIAGKVNVNPIVDAFVDEKDIIIMREDGDYFKIEGAVGIDGKDGIGITDAYIDDNGHLFFKTTEENVGDIDAGKVTVPVETDVKQLSNGDVVFTMSDGTEYNVGRIPGTYGMYVTEMFNNGEGIFARFSDDPSIPVKVGEIKGYPEKLDIDNDGHLVLTLNDNTVIKSENTISNKDGDGIESVWAEGADLYISYTTDNRTNTEVKKFEKFVGLGIVDIRNEDATLILELNDGSERRIDLPQGKDGFSIDEVFMEGNDLVFTFVNGEIDRYDIANIKGDGVEFIEKKDNGNLLFRNTSTEEEYELEVIRGKDGVGIESYSYDNDKKMLILDLSDENKIEVPIANGIDGVSIEDISYEDNKIKIIYGDDTLEFDVPAGIIQENSVENITYDSDNEELVIEYNKTENSVKRIPVPKPEIPELKSIDSVEIDEDDNIVFNITYQDDPVILQTIRGKDANGIKSISFNEENRQVEIVTTNEDNISFGIPDPQDGITIEEINYLSDTNTLRIELSDDSHYDIHDFRGKDGNKITDIKYDNANEEIIIELSDDSNYTVPFKQAVDGKNVTEIFVDEETNELVIRSELDPPYDEVRYSNIRGDDGIDGIGIDDITFDGNDITFHMTDENTYVVEDIGTSIVDVKLNDDGKLDIFYSNNTTITTDVVKGRDGYGKGVKDIKYNDGEFVFVIGDNYDDDIEIELGNLSTVPVEKVEMVEDELVFKLTNGEEISVGTIDGKNGLYIKSVDVDENNILTHVLTDGNSETEHIYNDIKGDDGRHVVSFDVDYSSGIVTVGFNDDTYKEIGNIREQTQVGLWSANEAPYSNDRVVIHNGRMFISKIDSNSSEPPGNNWNEVLLTDSIPSAMPPYSIIPDNVIINSEFPVFMGSPFLSRSPEIEREYREFEIKNTNNDEISIYKEESDTHTSHGLDEGIYEWRIRDKADNGFITDWSPWYTLEVSLSNSHGIVPHIIIPNNIDLNNAPLTFEVFLSGFSSDDPVTLSMVRRTTFLLKDEDGYLIKEFNIEGTEKIITSNDIENSKSYQLSAFCLIRINNNSILTEESDIIHFTVEDESDTYQLERPVLYLESTTFNEDDRNLSIRLKSSPLRRSESLIDSGIRVIHKNTDWEIIDPLSGEIVYNIENSIINKNEICIDIRGILVPNKDYKARVRYHTENLGSTEWSEWYDIKAISSIDKPILVTNEDVNNFPHLGVVEVSNKTNNTIADIPINSIVEVVDADSGELLYNANHFKESFYSYKIPLYLNAIDKEINVRVKLVGNYVSSEWSDYLVLNTKKIDYDTDPLLFVHTTFGGILSISDATTSSWLQIENYSIENQSSVFPLSYLDILTSFRRTSTRNTFDFDSYTTFFDRPSGNHFYTMFLSDNTHALTIPLSWGLGGARYNPSQNHIALSNILTGETVWEGTMPQIEETPILRTTGTTEIKDGTIALLHSRGIIRINVKNGQEVSKFFESDNVYEGKILDADVHGNFYTFQFAGDQDSDAMYTIRKYDINCNLVDIENIYGHSDTDISADRIIRFKDDKGRMIFLSYKPSEQEIYEATFVVFDDDGSIKKIDAELDIGHSFTEKSSYHSALTSDITGFIEDDNLYVSYKRFRNFTTLITHIKINLSTSDWEIREDSYNERRYSPVWEALRPLPDGGYYMYEFTITNANTMTVHMDYYDENFKYVHRETKLTSIIFPQALAPLSVIYETDGMVSVFPNNPRKYYGRMLPRR